MVLKLGGVLHLSSKHYLLLLGKVQDIIKPFIAYFLLKIAFFSWETVERVSYFTK